MYISVDQLKKSEERYASSVEPGLAGAAGDVSNETFIKFSPGLPGGSIIDTEGDLEKRKEMLETVSPEPLDFAFERVIGKNDSVYSNFVELISNAKRKVGRIAIKVGARNTGYATGFVVAENVVLTNWHVFQTIVDVADSEMQFFYELNTSGDPTNPVSFKFRSDLFYYANKDLDYCFVAINSMDISGKINIKDIGYIFLDPTLGKIAGDGEALNIIHHPDGDYMQLSIRENLFKGLTSTSVWYETDTAPGSSGSPVFNDQWQVVALHHMGVAKKNEAGRYIDKDGNEIPVIGGKIDTSKIVWEANEGIRVSVILKDLFNNITDKKILDSLQTMPGTVAIPVNEEQTNAKPKAVNEMSDIETTSNNVNISFPASLVERNGNINITISQGLMVPPAEVIVAPPALSDDEAFLLEIKLLEDSTDFSNCKGYQPGFLGSGRHIALPRPKTAIRKFIAKVNGTDSIVLRYYNYSTIFHSVRMMPIVSAINVDGDKAKRKDNAERKDTWLRDKRLSLDIQLSDNYYKNSGFDRGHMSRREDADWGATAEDAKRNADLTCMYTNACPQVAKINQSGKNGLWGILEKIVLEKGAEAETTNSTNKISVFNGPIFKSDDPVYKGIQVPMDFYKIVLWLSDDGKLKATAFKLSQQLLVSDIDFEELDLDQNTEFKEFQCSIKSLQDDTSIDFSAIIPFDTFEGHADIPLNSAAEVIAHVSKHK
ncbi:DNA/RNA non-specific endonuclease [Mucilaginibacter sp.]|jgi:endonuclease G|uniref:DNA/RNA non-specific endonuclease n=1 Tax=Mucilaginibacter sp. TaxID=1882438 RepID=UPI002B61E814|nr:DNA/RNA non-specific endonuclease [Mucilaginibacter sp.]HTI61608.1 DNA/RNA non-specific endonuclease [Mucilaginibacter sp.]